MKKFKSKLKGSAVMLVLFILVGVMIVVFGGASVIISGLKMGALQSQSTKAYFAAEAGAEKLLYEFRQNGLWGEIKEGSTPQENLFGTTTLVIGADYTVDYMDNAPLTFISIGSYEKTRRSVEVSFWD